MSRCYRAAMARQHGVDKIELDAPGACLECDLALAEHKVAKLQEFKDYVHKRLDEMGTPHDPNPLKTARTGCRIGNRLDYVEDTINGAIRTVLELRRAVGVSSQASRATVTLPRNKS